MSGLNYGRSFLSKFQNKEGIFLNENTGKWLVRILKPANVEHKNLKHYTTICACATKTEAAVKYVHAVITAYLPDLIEIEVMDVETIEPDRRYDYEVHTVTPYGCFFVEYFGGRKLYVRANSDITDKARLVAVDIMLKNIDLS